MKNTCLCLSTIHYGDIDLLRGKGSEAPAAAVSLKRQQLRFDLRRFITNYEEKEQPNESVCVAPGHVIIIVTVVGSKVY